MNTILALFVAVLWTSVSSTEEYKRTDLKAFTEDMVNYINGLNTTWKAGHNTYFSRVSMPVVRGMMGTKKLSKTESPSPIISLAVILNSDNLPEEFDARKQWPNCPTISEVRDQSNCGSCWAVSAAAAISDRICIATNGTVSPRLSANDLLSCCGFCGQGCLGGDVLFAWKYWVQFGLCTGGAYSKDGCKPYPFPPCEHYVNGSRPSCGHEVAKTPKCDETCQSSHSKPHDQDKYYGSKAYNVGKDQKSIQREIFAHGPVEAGFTVFEDFLMYKSGVYQHKAGSVVDGHAVKILGWGVENGTPYWLAANTWNSDWGDKGFFKIIRGTNDCGIEENIVGGLPKIKDTK